MTLPTSFLPDEDPGRPDDPGCSCRSALPTSQTLAVLEKVRQVYQKDPAVDYVFHHHRFRQRRLRPEPGSAFVRLRTSSCATPTT
ncbi:MAG: hypothetical protein WDN06_14265 [Asticcacaulis sp.]